MHRGPVVRFLGGAAAAATASAAAMTATTQLVAADDRMPEVGCQTAASATIGVTATGPGTHAPATTMAAVTVARRRLPWAGARSRVVYGGREVAIEVDGPSHFYGRRSGRTPPARRHSSGGSCGRRGGCCCQCPTGSGTA